MRTSSENVDLRNTWDEASLLPTRISVQAIHCDEEGLRVLVSGSHDGYATHKISVQGLIFFQNVNESFLNKRWQANPRSLDTPSLAVIENSTLIGKVAEMLNRRAEDWVHYSIESAEDCLEIITSIPPTIEKLGERAP